MRSWIHAPPLLLVACSGGSGPSPPGLTPVATDRIVADLTGVHAQVRVPGLDDRRFNHATYWDAVLPSVGRAVTSRVVGKSAEGRDIRQLSYGTGPVPVLLWSQMHGDESTASMALADLVRFFEEFGDHPVARRIATGSTVHLVPMLNPDGAERFQRRNAQGIDVNRDARRLQTPEAQTLKRVRDTVEPAFGFNLHDQSVGLRVGESDRGVAIALLAPAFNEVRDVDEKRRRAMQVASLLVDVMRPLVGDHIARYDDTFNPRAFGDLMGAWGASTILIESGGWADDPQKQHLRRTNFVGILAALDAIATGRWADYEPDLYESLEFNGDRVADLLVRGGTVAVPGLPSLEADLLVRYAQPLLEEGGVVDDMGDMGEARARDTLDVSGLYLIPMAEALDEDGGFGVGAPAMFVVAEDPEGRSVRFRFEESPPARTVEPPPNPSEAAASTPIPEPTPP